MGVGGGAGTPRVQVGDAREEWPLCPAEILGHALECELSRRILDSDVVDVPVKGKLAVPVDDPGEAMRKVRSDPSKCSLAQRPQTSARRKRTCQCKTTRKPTAPWFPASPGPDGPQNGKGGEGPHEEADAPDPPRKTRKREGFWFFGEAPWIGENEMLKCGWVCVRIGCSKIAAEGMAD